MAGALTMIEGAIGLTVRDTNGNATGDSATNSRSSVLTNIFTSSAGSELVTKWADHFPLEAQVNCVLHYGFTAGAGQQGIYLKGGGSALTDDSAILHDPFYGTDARSEVSSGGVA